MVVGATRDGRRGDEEILRTSVNNARTIEINVYCVRSEKAMDKTFFSEISHVHNPSVGVGFPSYTVTQLYLRGGIRARCHIQCIMSYFVGSQVRAWSVQRYRIVFCV